MKDKLDYLGVLLNGDDYFGKFLIRVILNHKVSTRCDAGLGRFSLTSDKKIIACPGSVGIDEMVVGTLIEGLNSKRMDRLWKIQSERKFCQTCEARFVCGGECMVVSYYKNKRLDNIDEVMCKLKKHLFKLAVMFKFEVLLHSDELFNNIYEGCQVKASRFEEDIELSNTLKKLSCKYTFMELKKIKDDDKETYLRIKE